MIPYYIGKFVDIISSRDFDKVYGLAFQLGIVVLVRSHRHYNIQASSIFTFIRAMYYNVMSERIAKALRLDLYSSLINKDVEFFDSRKTGDLCKTLIS